MFLKHGVLPSTFFNQPLKDYIKVMMINDDEDNNISDEAIDELGV